MTKIISISIYLIIFILFPFFLGMTNISVTKRCKTKIIGTYLGYESFTYKGIINCYPKFSYEFNNRYYIEQTVQSFNESYIQKHFYKNEPYSIYIDSTNPKSFVVENNVNLGAYICIIISIIFICLLIYLILKN